MISQEHEKKNCLVNTFVSFRHVLFIFLEFQKRNNGDNSNKAHTSFFNAHWRRFDSDRTILGVGPEGI